MSGSGGALSGGLDTGGASTAGSGGSIASGGQLIASDSSVNAGGVMSVQTRDAAMRDAGNVVADAGMDAGGQDASVNADRCDIAILDATHPPQTVDLSGNLGVHDPSLIEANGSYYLFYTGNGIGAKTSADLHTWQEASPVFAQNPSWIAQQVPGATNLWAPDISFFSGLYHLYYSASTFGSNHSCIGHATREALDSGSWTDRGSVICSNANGVSDDWNAIDPNVVVDTDGTPWLVFGSFWSGIKIVQLDESGARADSELHAIAARPSAGGAIEAPYIVRRCGYYYLFVSFDSCCKGADSTYKIEVGRSASILGPYVDHEGTPMLEGGALLVLQGADNWRGPGHNAVLFVGDAAYNVYHSYDANRNGGSFLRISELVWDADGWPISGGP